jgi:hypothetical protein
MSVLLCLLPWSGYAQTEKVIRAERVHESIEVDGRLDETGWKSATGVDDFVIQDPDEGKPLSERTEVRVLYDDKRLYIGFECWDSEPLKVIANEMRRDSNIWQNDNVYVMLDTYGDRRRNYFFRLNALGAYEDAAVTDDGENINGNWDAILDAAGRRHSEGWTLELAIPFNQLRFKESSSMTWGVNFGRNILYKHLSAQWAPIPRSESYMGTYRPRYQGRLVGLDGIRPSAHLDFVPYVLGGLSQEDGNDWDTRTESGIGIDVKYGITSNLTLDLTTNTDFAQVEADQEEVNLDRFDLYFPEKRDFFLEGSGLFDFGVGSGGFGPPRMSLFYSRRIGIEGNARARILGGGKLTGKVGGTTVALLNLTDEAVADVPKTNFTVLRVQQDILTRSTAGFILTSRQTGFGGQYARNAGVDLTLRPKARWQIRALTAGSFSPDESKSDVTWYLSNQYANDHFDFEVSHLDVGPDFTAETGYVQRTGIRQTGGRAGIAARPNWHGVSFVFLGSGGNYLTNHDGERIGYDFGSRLEFGRLAGGGTWIGMGRRSDRVDEAFDIESATVPAGDYDTVSYECGIFTPEQYPVASEIHLNMGDFFNGSRIGVNMRPRWRIAPQLAVEGWFDVNRIEFPGTELTTRVVGSRAHFTLNTKFYTKLFAQWNDTAERVGANLLVRYIYRPGSDFYVVYDQRWDASDGMRVSGWTLLSKFTYLVSY